MSRLHGLTFMYQSALSEPPEDLDFRGPEFSSPPPAATDRLFSPQEVKLTFNIREYIEQRGDAVTGPLSRVGLLMITSSLS